MFIYLHVYIFICLYIYMFIYLYVYIFICLYVYIFIHALYIPFEIMFKSNKYFLCYAINIL